jgi:hypothetical protein
MKFKLIVAMLLVTSIAGAQQKPAGFNSGKAKKQITKFVAGFDAVGEMDDDDDSLSPLALQNIFVTTFNKKVPVLFDGDMNSLAAKLSTGSGVCRRAGIDAIGWLWTIKEPAKKAEPKYGAFSVAIDFVSSIGSGEKQSTESITGVTVDAYGKIITRPTDSNHNNVVQVYCIPSVPASKFLACQLQGAKEADASKGDASALIAAACANVSYVAPAFVTPAVVVETPQPQQDEPLVVEPAVAAASSSDLSNEEPQPLPQVQIVPMEAPKKAAKKSAKK